MYLNIARLIMLVLVSVTACSKQKKVVNEKTELVKVTEKHFPIDTITNLKSWFLDIYETDTATFLVYENKYKPSIQFYNLDTELLEFELDLIQTGPNGVGTVNGFYIHSIDSIYLLNVSDMRLFLVNRNGEVQNYFSFLNPIDGFPYGSMSTPTIISGSSAIYYKDYLHMAARPGTGPINKETFEFGKVNLAINLSTGEYYLNFNYPDIYKRKNFGNFWGKIFRSKTHDDQIVYSFSADEKIYVTDYVTTSEFFAGSSYFKEPTPYDDLSQIRENNIRSTMYGGIFYDKYRNLYYRVVTGGRDEVNITHVEREIYDDKPISIIILDLNFEKIGETLLPSKTHDPLGVCVGPDGLYVSNSNFENPKLKEDILSFTVYLPQELK